MSEYVLSSVHLGSALFEQVWRLYRKNTNTLGFLPRGAFEQFALAGCILSICSNEDSVGYVAWRNQSTEAVLVHLCVDAGHRGTGCHELLLRGMIDQCRNIPAIRLRCRKDYSKANRVWERHGFRIESELVGRGMDAAPLFEWRRVNFVNAPLLDAIRDATPKAKYLVAIDANVFFDVVDPERPHHEESSSLFADWLDDVEVCVTQELRSECMRPDDEERRSAAFALRRGYTELACHPDELAPAVTLVESVLPPSTSDSDHSDRRQLAHAWKGGATYFATRDSLLLDHSDDIRSITGLFVMRPSELVARLQGDLIGNDYAPVRLQGTSIERRPAAGEEELLAFQRFAAGESKGEWLKAIRSARSAPDRCSVEVVGPKGADPRVLVAVDWSSPDALHIRILRALSSDLTGTLLRRVLADMVEAARSHNRYRITIADPGPGEIQNALNHVGFEVAKEGRMVRFSLPGIIDFEQATTVIDESLPDAKVEPAPKAQDLEARFWPLKVLSAEIPTYVIPIHRHWAAELFDRGLASQHLFGVPEGPALALENVYYSGSNIRIPPGSRMLWYVSGKIGQIRGMSTCIDTDTDEANRLSKKYHRLGVYRWRHILETAGGDPHKRLHAYRFAQTVLFEKPIPWSRLSQLIFTHTETRNPIASPVRVPEALFIDVYREGTVRKA